MPNKYNGQHFLKCIGEIQQFLQLWIGTHLVGWDPMFGVTQKPTSEAHKQTVLAAAGIQGRDVSEHDGSL